MELILLFLTCLVLTEGQGQNVTLHGPADTAQTVSKSVVMYCNVVKEPGDGGSSNLQYDKPYIVNWTFTPLGSTTSRVIVKWTHHYNKSYTNLTSHPEKYHNTMPVHLQISDLTLDDAGTYGCWSNVTSPAIKTAQLYLIEMPSCRNENPETQYKQNITLDCSVTFAGAKAPLLYWKHGDQDLNSTKTLQNATSMRASLRMVANSDMNGHIYNCHVAYPQNLLNVVCQALPAMKIYVPVKVSQVWSLPHVTTSVYKLGAAVELHCLAKGYPSPHYSWSFAPRDNITGFVRLSSNSFYNINHFKPRDQGTYRCAAVNDIDGISYNDSLDINVTIDESAALAQGGENAAYTIAKHDEREISKIVDHRSPLQTNVTYIEREGFPHHSRRFRSIFSPYAIGALISAGLAILLIIVFVALAMRMKKRERKMREKISRGHDEMLDDQEVELLDESLQHQPEYMPSEYSKLRMSWEIPRRDIRLVEQIGKGSYVEVWKGRMRKQPGTNDIMRVAIKKLISESTENERRLFVSELEVMKMLPAHINIIRLIGSYTTNEPWLVMLEYTSEGSLLAFLQKHRPGQQEVVINHSNENQAVRLQNQTLDPHKLLALAAQIASGLDHLQRFKLIYYRLKTARVLVGKGGICKLSGFGFPQEVAERNIYELSSSPVRWLAPECLAEKVFSIKTDVWAYGIVLWEILHFGMTPYPAMGPQEVLERVQSGYRMPQPQHCSPHLFNMMSACWHGNPEDRPTYSQIIEALTELAQDHYTHIMFDRLPDYLKTPDAYEETVS
ncbi:fibroblast growth factor receptor homolog 1-like isoform X1 [Haliotis rufescens]|uniref:fibroblast growth factor receptor homolog 1-like isoform X1 n=1 Tax=Haliotis rufescens TaxID=6454 RepID=UPI001EAF9914|nr:fibroblast growth factor receptor homolog 1-like isoform X1 [Haliotis rufescens]